MIYSHLTVATAGFAAYVHYVTDGQWDVTTDLWIGFGLVLVGACLPDIDHPDSTIGRKLKWISYPIRAVFGHRGITHSLLAVMLIFYLSYKFDSTIISWLCFGYFLHLVGDYLTDSGIPLAYPSSKRYRFILVGSTNSASEYVMVGLVLISVFAFIQLY